MSSPWFFLSIISRNSTPAHSGYDDAKMIDIIGKTLRKMSPKGHAAAMALPLPERTRKLIEAALAREAEALKKLAQVAID